MPDYCEIPRFSKTNEDDFADFSQFSLEERAKRGFDKARIYIKIPCPFCDKAISLLEQFNIPFEVVDVTDNPDLRAKIAESQNDYPTVPMIFMQDKFIGGCDDLIHSLRTGHLN
ncbi:MAG: glutathione S-transferase N-terminal domain-containing protein [Proteobacteria bacterium]|nr:glutathione S-transferase N-terminal domain-containing protein [Pseudomonadota bacterium]